MARCCARVLSGVDRSGELNSACPELEIVKFVHLDHKISRTLISRAPHHTRIVRIKQTFVFAEYSKSCFVHSACRMGMFFSHLADALSEACRPLLLLETLAVGSSPACWRT